MAGRGVKKFSTDLHMIFVKVIAFESERERE